jgi:flagellar hook-basal body complex protein FliE
MTDMNMLTAANAYRNQLKMQQDAGQAAGTEDQAKPSFSDMVQEAAKGAIDTQYKSEALQMEAMTSGKVELSDLVTAVANADLTLNTVVAIRDRVIAAYEDIIKMPI